MKDKPLESVAEPKADEAPKERSKRRRSRKPKGEKENGAVAEKVEKPAEDAEPKKPRE